MGFRPHGSVRKGIPKDPQKQEQTLFAKVVGKNDDLFDTLKSTAHHCVSIMGSFYIRFKLVL